MKNPQRIGYLAAGVMLTALAALGIVLPLLPTTPLLLLAAACFARSSERCHHWLLGHRIFGPIIRNWQEKRCMARRAKFIALMTVILFGGFAVGVAIENSILKIIGSILLTIGLVTILRIRTCEHDQ